MKIFSRILAAGFFFVATFLIAPQALCDQDKEIHVEAKSVEYFHEESKIVGIGNVRIENDGDILTADKMTVYTDQRKAIAEGHVTLAQRDLSFTGDVAEYDFVKHSGIVKNIDAQVGPTVFMKAKQVEQVSAGEFKATDAYVTTCCGDSPFYRVQAKEAHLYPDDKVVLKNAVVYVNNVPIFYIPKYVQPVINTDRFPVQIIPGKNSEWGAYVLSKWRYRLIEGPDFQSKGNVLLDLREDRGVAGGVENFYQSKVLGKGAIRTYYADDQEPPIDADDERYRVQWRHQLKLGDSTSLKIETHKLSDPSIIKDFFFREEYESGVAPENYVSLVTAKPEFALTVLESWRMDDFFDKVEKVPQITFDTYNRKFAGLPFYYRQENSYTNFQREFKDSSEDFSASRFDTNHTFSYPVKLSAVSVVGRLGTRQSVYTRGQQENETLHRGTFDPGLDVSTRFFKTYDTTVKGMGLDWNKIRHIFNPNAAYFFRPNPTRRREELYQFDPIDGLDKQNVVRLALENRFQTKSHDRQGQLYSRELLRVIPFVEYDINSSESQSAGVELEFRPYTWLGVEADVFYADRSRDVNVANFDVYAVGPNWKASVGQRYVRDESSQLTLSGLYRFNKEWALRAYERYEFETGSSKEFEIGVSKMFNCWTLNFIYNHSDNNSDSFYVTVKLNGYPDSSFNVDQGYEHPRAQTALELPASSATL